MIRSSIAIATVAFCLAGLPVLAQVATPALADPAAPPDTAGGRYLFEKQPAGQSSDHAGGYLRLDTQTGEVALCSQRGVGWACQAAPEDRTVLENEIARLRTENAALKKEI